MTKENLQNEAAQCIEQIVQTARKLARIEERFYKLRKKTKPKIKQVKTKDAD